MLVNSDNLISIRDLKVHYPVSAGVFAASKTVKAVDGVTLDITRGETLGLVGESGCGKSTLGRAILRLTEATSGAVFHGDKNIFALTKDEMRRARSDLQIIFQDPYASLNPRMTADEIIAEPLRTFGTHDKAGLAEAVNELMDAVGLDRELKLRRPSDFSGGQRQRIGIARALAVGPEFIVADEPISALDVSIGAQIMNLLRRLQTERGLTYLFISHDLRAVGHISDRVAVMYLGRIVELALSRQLYSGPLMPYTKALVSAIPSTNPEAERNRVRIVLKGDLPSPIDPPTGCHFHTRCPFAIAECSAVVPELREIRAGHFAACIRISHDRPNIEQNDGLGALEV
ncbi:MAG: oligopeptide/dipeptide ABC transporter ATP-binding protein [Pyrinomonadaceae bacterium]